MADKVVYNAETVKTIYANYKKECDTAYSTRKMLNKENFDMYHLKQDFSSKQKGQSCEVLPKVAMAVEQNASFLQQGLIDMGNWFKTTPAPGISDDVLKVKTREQHALLTRALTVAKFMGTVGDAAKNGFLASQMIVKVTGKWVPKYKYKAETKAVNGSFKKKLVRTEDKKWQLAIELVQPGDYRKDPTGRDQYEMQDIYMDYHQVEALAKGKDAIYDLAAVQELKASASSPQTDRTFEKSKETGQDVPMNAFRKQVKLTEIWGNFIDSDGNLLYENCVCTIANDQYVIQAPTENKLWHGQSPYVCTALITVPGSTTGKALMDAGVALNRATNEFFNLILDGGIGSVHGIKQVREHWLEDPSQVENGIPQGETLRVNTACPPGGQVLERVDTATVPPEAINIYNLLVQEGNTAMMTSDMRMGAQSMRAVKATQIVETSNAIDSLLGGIAKRIESEWVIPILHKAWAMIAQHIDQMDEDELKMLLGPKRAAEILGMGPEELFAETVGGCQYDVFGISSTLNKMKDFTKLTAMLQTISSNPQLYEAFLKDHDMVKLLQEILLSLDINVNKLRADDAPNPNAPVNPAEQGAAEQMQMQGQQGQADMQSQIPQAGAAANQGDLNPIQQPDFPPSKATPAS